MFKKITIVVFLLTFTANAQEDRRLSTWISFGFGASSFGQGDSHWSKSGNLGIACSYSHLTLKYGRRVNSEFTFASSENQAKSHELMLGYSISLDPDASQSSALEFCIDGGIGSLEQTTSTNVESATCVPLELELRLKPTSFVGLSITGFSLISGFKPIFGAQVNLLIGYL